MHSCGPAHCRSILPWTTPLCFLPNVGLPQEEPEGPEIVEERKEDGDQDGPVLVKQTSRFVNPQYLRMAHHCRRAQQSGSLRASELRPSLPPSTPSSSSPRSAVLSPAPMAPKAETVQRKPMHHRLTTFLRKPRPQNMPHDTFPSKVRLTGEPLPIPPSKL